MKLYAGIPSHRPAGDPLSVVFELPYPHARRIIFREYRMLRLDGIRPSAARRAVFDHNGRTNP